MYPKFVFLELKSHMYDISYCIIKVVYFKLLLYNVYPELIVSQMLCLTFQKQEG